jgi:ketosteroid isomerase-like protein
MQTSHHLDRTEHLMRRPRRPAGSMERRNSIQYGRAETKGDETLSSDLVETIEQYHRAVNAFVTGNLEPQKELFSRRDNVTLANPLGPPARGWDQVEDTLERAASLIREGEPVSYERISEDATDDMAYIVEIERTRLKAGDADELAPVSLRVTTIFRREDDAWKIAHRHADPITTPRPIETALES